MFTNQRKLKKKKKLRHVHDLCNQQRLYLCKYKEMKIQTLECLHLAGCVQAQRLLVKRREIWEGIQPQITTLKRYRQQYSSRNIPWCSKEGQVQSDHRVSPGVGAEGLEAATQSRASAPPGQSVRKIPGKPFRAAVGRDGREEAGVAVAVKTRDTADRHPRRTWNNPSESPRWPRGRGSPKGQSSGFHLSSKKRSLLRVKTIPLPTPSLSLSLTHTHRAVISHGWLTTEAM